MGTPTNEVIIPTGITVGEKSVLPKVSHNRRNTPPQIAVHGIRCSSLFPMAARTMWGTTNPTNAITPKNETTIDVQRVQQIKVV